MIVWYEEKISSLEATLSVVQQPFESVDLHISIEDPLTLEPTMLHNFNIMNFSFKQEMASDMYYVCLVW